MAGSWTGVTPSDGYANGAKVPIQRLEAVFTDDDTTPGAATIPSLAVGGSDSGGVLQRVSYTPGATAPTGASFTIKVTDKNGVVIGNPDGTAITGATNITVNAAFVGLLYVVVTDNETAAATGTVSLYVLG